MNPIFNQNDTLSIEDGYTLGNLLMKEHVGQVVFDKLCDERVK
jgi:hypothetical protein